MIQGLRTAIYPVGDLTEGKAWYAQLLQAQPYFDEPYYVGFSVQGFELGLIPDGTPGRTGVQVYWGVEDIEAALVRVSGLGVTIGQALQDVGGGIRVASILDPYGNEIGLIENPHFGKQP